METATINFYRFTTKVRKTASTAIINGSEHHLWKVAKKGKFNDYIEVEPGMFAMVWHDPRGWHVGEAYPVAR